MPIPTHVVRVVVQAPRANVRDKLLRITKQVLVNFKISICRQLLVVFFLFFCFFLYIINVVDVGS
jgi:hypothetical protein